MADFKAWSHSVRKANLLALKLSGKQNSNNWTLHYRLTFDLDNKNEIPGKNLLKVVKFQNLVEEYCNVFDIALQSLQIFSLLCYVRKLLPLSAQKW